MDRHIFRLSAMAVLTAATAVTVISETSAAGPPAAPTALCSVGAIPFSQPLSFVTNSGTALAPGISAGQMLAMVGGQNVDTRLGGSAQRPYFLELAIYDELGDFVSESRFIDGQAISLSFPTNSGPLVKPYTVRAAVGRAADASGADGCYSPLTLSESELPTLANVEVAPPCSLSFPARSFDLGGNSVVGQPYNHTFNASSVGSGPMGVDIVAIGGATLPSPVSVIIGNKVSYTPQAISTKVDYRTFVTAPPGGTWDQRICFRYGFVFETASSPSSARSATVTAKKPRSRR
jgi:hypothetical protein